MSKELQIPQGIYCVGVDFPEGSYLFNSKGTQTTILLDLNSSIGGEFEKTFTLNEKNNYSCRIYLSKEDRFEIDNSLYVTMAEKLEF